MKKNLFKYLFIFILIVFNTPFVYAEDGDTFMDPESGTEIGSDYDDDKSNSTPGEKTYESKSIPSTLWGKTDTTTIKYNCSYKVYYSSKKRLGVSGLDMNSAEQFKSGSSTTASEIVAGTYI